MNKPTRRRYATITLKDAPRRYTPVSYHTGDDLRLFMESLGYREGSYKVKPEYSDPAPSAWREVEVDVNGLLGIYNLAS